MQTVLIRTTDKMPRVGVEEENMIGFNDVTFTWDSPSAVGTREFKLRIDGCVTFERGAVNLVVGPTGAGKTSLLFALLGEMYYLPRRSESWYNLPRAGGIAYAAQESWVLNDTVRVSHALLRL